MPVPVCVSHFRSSVIPLAVTSRVIHRGSFSSCSNAAPSSHRPLPSPLSKGIVWLRQRTRVICSRSQTSRRTQDKIQHSTLSDVNLMSHATMILPTKTSFCAQLERIGRHWPFGEDRISPSPSLCRVY